MKYISQADFPHDRIIGEVMSEAFADLVQDIAGEEGLI